MDTIIRASSFKEKVNKILIPYNTTLSRKKKLIDEGYILESYFGNNDTIIKKATEKKINACLVNNNIIIIKKI